MLDFHNHLIPQVDDGSESLEASANAIAAMREQGIDTIITTPHLGASSLRTAADHDDYFATVDAHWKLLSERAASSFPDVRLHRGFEILLDDPHPDLTDSRTRLAGTKFVLVEFRFSSVPPNSAQVLFDLRVKGYEPIVAHPERYLDAQTNLNVIEEWIRVGCPLQLNAGSFVGNYGREAERTAWEILAKGWASYVSSDYHARGVPATKDAADAIARRAGSEAVDVLFTTNPEKILVGERPTPVAPMRKESGSWLDRVLGRS